MAEVFSSAFSAEQHAQWSAKQYAWDPSQLHVLPSASPGSASDGSPSDQVSEGLGSSSGAQRDQSLGPVPIGWQETSRGAGSGGKEAKGAHTRAPKGPLVCQVEGCGHDLSLEKGYYQRYRVCEPHMKLLSLVVNGKACRFCQQCGRFQELTEFDGNKRSCRARLLQHNARRRKRDPLDTSRKEQPSSRKSKSLHPWSDSSNDADMGSGDVGPGVVVTEKSLTNYSFDSGVDQSGKVRMAFGHVSQVSTGGAPTWGAAGLSGMVDVEPLSSANQLQQVPMSDQQQPQPLVNADLARCFSGALDAGAGSLDDMLDGILGSTMDYLDDPRVVAVSQAGGADVRGGLAGPGMPGVNSISSNLPYGETAAFDTMPLSNQGMLTPGGGAGYPGSMPTSGAWQSGGMPMETGPSSASDLAAALNKRAMQQRQLQEFQLQQQQQQQLVLQQQQQQQQLLLQQQQQQQQQFAGRLNRSTPLNTGGSSMMHLDNYVQSNSSIVSGGAGAYDTGMGTAAASGPLGSGMVALNRGPWTPGNSMGTPVSGPQMLSGMSVNTQPMMGMGALNAAQAAASGSSASVSSSFDLARRLVASGGAAAKYESEDLLVRVSIKIANCMPDQLPADLYQRLRNLLNSADASLVQGYLRPGCTHLVLDVQLAATPADPFGDFGDELPSGRPALPFSPNDLRGLLGPIATRSTVLVQTEDEVALWQAGASVSAGPCATARMAELQASKSVPAIEHVSAAAHVDEDGRAAVVVYGSRLAAAGVTLFARMQGGYLPCTVQPLVIDGEVVTNEEAQATATAAHRCMAALTAAGRQAADAVLLTVDAAPGTGLLVVEAQAGPLLSNWRPCLLLTDCDMAAELVAMNGRALHAGRATTLASLEAFVIDLGRVLDKRSYCGMPAIARQPTDSASNMAINPPASDSDVDDDNFESEAFDSFDDCATQSSGEDGVTLALVCVCERLLAWAADVGTARVASFLAGALRQYGQDMQAILEAPYADGLSVVHRCMRSKNAETVRSLIRWAASSKVRLAWGSVGALGLSPLHLAALVPALWPVLASQPSARACWETAAAPAGGVTPAQLQRLLLARLPKSALPLELVHAFAPPVRAIQVKAVSHQAAGDSVSKITAVSSAAVAKAPVNPVPAARVPAVPPAVGAASAVLVFAMAAVLFVLQPAVNRGRPAEGGPRNFRQAVLQRIAPDYENFDHSLIFNCCSSMLYLGLLGIAAFLLPVKTLLSGVHPASTCLGAP